MGEFCGLEREGWFEKGLAVSALFLVQKKDSSRILGGGRTIRMGSKFITVVSDSGDARLVV